MIISKTCVGVVCVLSSWREASWLFDGILRRTSSELEQGRWPTIGNGPNVRSYERSQRMKRVKRNQVTNSWKRSVISCIAPQMFGPPSGPEIGVRRSLDVTWCSRARSVVNWFHSEPSLYSPPAHAKPIAVAAAAAAMSCVRVCE